MKRLYQRICGFFKRKHSRIEQKLTPDALAAVAREAEFLRSAHNVSVRALSKGEKPGKPEAASTEPPAR